MATIKYKQTVIHRPENISMNLLKEIRDRLGRDYSFTVNDVVQLISDLNAGKIDLHDPVTKIQIANPIDLYERPE